MEYRNYSLANAVIIFGALQGVILIFFLTKRRHANPLAFLFFAMFLFSLAYVNLWYGLYFMGIHDIFGMPLSIIPFPYEFLLGTGFYFYVKSHKNLSFTFLKKDIYVFAPALIYGILLSYWYYVRVRHADPNIYRELEDIGFFLIVEYLRFAFNLILAALALQFLKKTKNENQLSVKEGKALDWLLLFTKVFFVFNLVSLVFTALTFVSNPYSLASFYFTFFTNTVFVYWIGYVGYTKPHILFNMVSSLSLDEKASKNIQIEEKLKQIMVVEKQFLDPNFSLSRLSTLTGLSSKELSDYINNFHKCNVSDYINQFRVEKVKELLADPQYDKYTLVAISQEAGFNSRSSFNLVFKKITSLSPSTYRRMTK